MKDQNRVVEITKKDEAKYLQFVANHPLGSIHQTLEWAEFQVKLNGRDKYWCLAVEDTKGQIIASALVIRQTLPFKKCWLYCPRGPLADFEHPQALNQLLAKIRELASQNDAVFLRFDPPILEDQNIDWNSLHAYTAHAHYQPQNTLILDLYLSQEDLLKQMKPKGRYNIKVAQKHGVKIRLSSGDQKDIDAFYELLQQTTGRDKFSGHNKKFYQDMLAILSSPEGKNDTHAQARMSANVHTNAANYTHASAKPQAKLYLAEYQNKIIAGIIVTVFKDTAIYYFGASGNEHRNIMAPYLLQWQAILDAKVAGLKYYDFLGIAPQIVYPQNASQTDHDPNHPWAGVTDFKLKFGGSRINYQPAQEIIYQPFWYWLITFIKKIRGSA